MMIDYCNAMQWICCEESRRKKMMIDYYCNAMQWIGGGDRRQQPKPSHWCACTHWTDPKHLLITHINILLTER